MKKLIIEFGEKTLKIQIPDTQQKPKNKAKSYIIYSDIGPALPTADRHLDTPG